MRDMAENIVVLDCIRAASQSSGAEVNTRANGVMNTAGYIDLEDYNYPRKMLICNSVGTLASTGDTLNIDIEHGDSTGALATDTGTTFTEIVGVATDVVTEYTPTKRYINIEALVLGTIVHSITLIMDHSRSGAQSGLVT